MHLLLFDNWLLHHVVHFYHSFSSIVWSCHKICYVPIIRHSWNDGMKVSMRTSSVFLLAFIGLKSNIHVSVCMCLHFCIVHKRISCCFSRCLTGVVCVCVCVLDFLRPLFSQLCVEGSWIFFVLLRFAEHRNQIEIGDFFSAFLFHSKKIVVLNLE